MTDRVDLEAMRQQDLVDELRRIADSRGRVIDRQMAELASLRAQRDAALALCAVGAQSDGLARRVRAALGVQPEPVND
jgi:hypothetical protein